MDGIMTLKNVRYLGVVVIAGLLSGCASMEIPDFDFIKFPEFKQDAENIGDYPKVEDAPQVPKNVRSDKQWDVAAKKIIAKRDSIAVPENTNTQTDAEIERDIEKLRLKVDAYKKDDPE